MEDQDDNKSEGKVVMYTPTTITEVVTNNPRGWVGGTQIHTTTKFGLYSRADIITK